MHAAQGGPRILLRRLREIMAEKFLEYETDEILAKLEENDVPASKCLPYEEVIAHPQYAANKSIDEHDHPVMGNMLRVKLPAQFEGERIEPGAASPRHGQHTEEILRARGKSDEEIAALVEANLARGPE